jgi:hypothetical protein
MPTTITAPNEWNFVGNPVLIRVTNHSYPHIFVKILDGPTELVTAKFQVFNGEATIDLSGYIKNLIPSDATVNYSVDITESSTHKALNICIYYVYSNPYYNETHQFILGVSQILGNDTNQYQGDAPNNKFLTGFTVPKYWLGFPFSISYIRSCENYNSEAVVVFDIEGGVQAYSSFLEQLEKGVCHFAISNHNAEIEAIINVYNKIMIQTNAADDLSVSQTVQQVVQLVNSYQKEPVYLRWLNELGGFDYYLFYKKDTRETVRSSYVNKYPLTIEPINGTQEGTLQVYKKEIGETWVIGADDIPLAEYDELKKIGRSFKIDLWLPNKNTWLGVNIQDATYPTPQEEELIDAELILIMPEIFS